MDKKKRVVLTESKDAMTKKYPLIGIWVAGVPRNTEVEELQRLKFLGNPLVWAACIRFLEN
jgi:hypothetical protein